MLFSCKVECVSVVLGSGLSNALEPGQILEDLRGFQLVPPLVNARARSVITEFNSWWKSNMEVIYSKSSRQINLAESKQISDVKTTTAYLALVKGSCSGAAHCAVKVVSHYILCKEYKSTQPIPWQLVKKKEVNK